MIILGDRLCNLLFAQHAVAAEEGAAAAAAEPAQQQRQQRQQLKRTMPATGSFN